MSVSAKFAREVSACSTSVLESCVQMAAEPVLPYPNREANQLTMRPIPDLMMALSSLTSDSVRQIRKTAEDPPRVSVLDVIAAVTGMI